MRDSQTCEAAKDIFEKLNQTNPTEHWDIVQLEGDALGKPAKSTVPGPREKCGCALKRIFCHKLVQNSKFMLSVEVIVIENT